MRLNFHGQVVNEDRIKVGFIGCGSHSFRNVYPTFQFAPVELKAVCDLDPTRAAAFARAFGGAQTYTSHKEMLEKEILDAVFIVTGYDTLGRPTYPPIVQDALAARCHVWMEKPPAASCAEITALQKTAKSVEKSVMVGFKKMFMPANEKAQVLSSQPDFGAISLVTLRYPLYLPSQEEFGRFSEGKKEGAVTGFLDHLCHPASMMVYLLGKPNTLSYERSNTGAGVATFTFPSGAVATIACSSGASSRTALEGTVIVGEKGHHIEIENNLTVKYHRGQGLPYGASPDFYKGEPGEVTSLWEPEFSLGQLYNKGLFIQGYYNEIKEFCDAIGEGRKPSKATLEDAWIMTRLFEAFFEGPGHRINI